jgi:hypothetical protein
MMNTYILFRSKLHKQFFFIKRYIDKKIINYILMDDGSTINILSFKIIKELGIYIYGYV